MVYNLLITEKAAGQIDQLTDYLINTLKNPDAALHFLDELDSIYQRFKTNPFQFPKASDLFLPDKEYREAILLKMSYRVIFRIEEKTVYIICVFHTLEDYESKINHKS